MGSGTTLVEALKLGMRVIGRDINPVSFFMVRNALSIHDSSRITATFLEIEEAVADQIGRYYKSKLPTGQKVDVLYFFWVKTIDCPLCSYSVDLFSSYVFAQHAYPRRYPDAQALCPNCGAVNRVNFDSTEAACSRCAVSFNPQHGPVAGQLATCPSCHGVFQIARTVRNNGHVPRHRLFAKLVLMPNGSKMYLQATGEDSLLYAEAEEELKKRKDAYPIVAIAPGYNTNQALGYNYRFWHEMFNARQLLCISILADRIRAIPEPAMRDLFVCLLSGVLEFNNMFASYKGEGTGAVRHMFAHHILKPERVPLEANLWGTPKSSGSFSTLFEGRIRRAMRYAENPFEIVVDGVAQKHGSRKVFGLSEKIGFPIEEEYRAFESGGRVYLSCGDSSQTEIAEKSVDAVVTDPPFFDNVHYSQLADFFHVWQRHISGANGHMVDSSTRLESEVQNEDAAIFTSRLTAVWKECHRVLKDNGVLIFTYHHSRPDGWRSVLTAIMEGGFVITAAHPIKSEMSVAMPKHLAKEPIDIDIIIVCRKRSQTDLRCWDQSLQEQAVSRAADQVERLRRSDRRLSRNDVRVVVMAQTLMYLSACESVETAAQTLDSFETEIADSIEKLYGEPLRAR